MAMYFEDFPVGFVYESETRQMPLEEITRFASDWDPQPFHVDEAAAKHTIYGGLIASGWHTLTVAFRLWYDSGLWAEASMGSPGMENVRWLKPVRPGDTLRVRVEVIESNPSKSRPDRGRITARSEVYNQDGDKVAEYTGIHILKTRTAGAQ